jgi:monoamine oxidase
MHDVLIIGSGIAGLAAASHLRRSGKSVIILEAEEQIGGRIQTVDWQGMRLDSGASYCHGIYGTPVNDLLTQAGCSLHRQKFHHVKNYPDNVGSELFKAFLYWFEDQDFDHKASLRVAINRFKRNMALSLEDERKFSREVASFINGEYGVDADQISARAFHNEGEFAGGDYFVMGGYERVLAPLSHEQDIRCHHEVELIEDHESHFLMRCANIAHNFKAKHIICTLSLGALKLQKSFFGLTLPLEKTKAIADLGMGNLTKTFMLFEDNFWGEQSHFGIVGENEQSLFQEFVNLAPLYGKPLLLAFHGGKTTATLDTNIIDAAHSQLIKAFPNAVRALDALHIDWSKTRAEGSYSYVPAGKSFQLYNTLAKPFGNIHFAGEHTNIKHPMTAAGAYESGVRAALEILEKRGLWATLFS